MTVTDAILGMVDVNMLLLLVDGNVWRDWCTGASLKALAFAAASSAAVGLEVTTSVFKAGALRELQVAMVCGHEII
jgi:hypothetical protein